MDVNEYIESGILELYVAGALSEKENEEVYHMMQQHPEILSEVLKIEAAVMQLTAGVAPKASKFLLQTIKSKLGLSEASKVVDISTKKSNWFSYVGWAASIVLAAGLLWMYTENKALQSDLNTVVNEKGFLESQIENAQNDLAEAEKLITILRDKDIIAVPLGGQGNFENAYAKVYWNKKDNSIYLDAQGLPDAPAGKVYQVWSLTLDPLTPTSLGTIDDFNTDDNKIFAIANTNESQAFGITLEPEGGSESPTMDQLYTLGVVATQP